MAVKKRETKRDSGCKFVFMNKIFGRYRTIIVCAFLVFLTFLAYYRVLWSDFVNFDDTLYVTENRHVQAGLTVESVLWAFRSTDVSYWQPLAWISHMVDCELFGLRAGMHHLSSLVIHIFNSLLVLLVLKRLTGAFWASVFVAGLFALHPFNVDSVAWIAERKNVLSTTFWLLTIWAYGGYARRGGMLLYLASILLFVLGLLAKPMLVTLPFVLILLDYWPLRRFGLGFDGEEQASGPVTGFGRLLLEKVPFFVLMSVSAYVQLSSVDRPDVVVSRQFVPMGLRLAVAPVSYVQYMIKMIWPLKLAVYYPYPKTAVVWESVCAVVLLVVLSVVLIWMLRSRRYAVVGWLWFVGTLVPVSGLYQVGLWPFIGDRWVYVPLLGLFVIIAWSIADIAEKWRVPKIAIALPVCAWIAALGVCTWYQTGFWKDGEALFRRALAVTENNVIAHYNLGNVLLKRGQTDDAVEQYRLAKLVNPQYIDAHYNLGIALAALERHLEAVKAYRGVLGLAENHKKVFQRIGDSLAKSGQVGEALVYYEKALAKRAGDTEVLNNYGLALVKAERVDEAIGVYQESLEIDPNSVEILNNLGNALVRQKKFGKALERFEKALLLKADFIQTHLNMARALSESGQKERAVERYQQALEIEPDNVDAYYGLGLVFVELERYADAERYLGKSIELNPRFAQAYYRLGLLYVDQGKIDEAIGQFEAILEMYPKDAEMHCNLGTLLVRQGAIDRAIEEFKIALELNPNFTRARQQLEAAQALKNW